MKISVKYDRNSRTDEIQILMKYAAKIYHFRDGGNQQTLCTSPDREPLDQEFSSVTIDL